MPYEVQCQMQYCVYTHSHNGRVFYVGSGKLQRPFDMVRRSPKWKAYVALIQSYHIDIILLTNNVGELAEVESQFIRKFKPVCNFHRKKRKARIEKPKVIRSEPPMPAPIDNPYSFRKPSSARNSYVYRSFRMHPEVFAEIEALAAEEAISVNSLCNALMALTLDLAESAAGRATIHQFCTDWRTRYEYAETARRRTREGE